MSIWMIILIALWAPLCTVWALLLVAQYGAARRGLLLKEKPRGSGGGPPDAAPPPTVCVVIPARNEAANLPRCLRSVLAQDYPALSVLVADDRSDDDTARIAERIARCDARLSVERITTLPPGWLGKSHALWRATRRVTSVWILFLDADCTLESGALRTAVDEALRRGIDLLTLWPRHAAGGFWEHLIIPLCGGIIALWFGSNRVNDATSRLAFANGQFLLIRREAYERIDGHRCVRRAVIEDIPFAEQAKRAGVRCRVASGRDLVNVRMYATYRGIRDGWARIYLGALRSGLRIGASMMWLVLGSLLPYVAALVLFTPGAASTVEWAGGASCLYLLRCLCALHLLLVNLVSYRFWGMGGCPRRYLLLYPAAVLIVMGILARAWWWLIVARSVSWGRTRYRIDRRGVIVG